MRRVLGLSMAFGFLFIALPIFTLVGAIILRAATSAANKILGPQTATQPDDPNAEDIPVESGETADPTNPYAAPVTVATAIGATDSNLAIPEPSFGKAIGISIVATILSFAISFVLGILGQVSPTMQFVSFVLSWILNFLATSFVFSKMLPTTFGRGILVNVMYLLIALLVGAVIVGVVYVVAAFMGVRF